MNENTQETGLVVAEENNKPAINSNQAAAEFFTKPGKTFNLWTSLPLEDKAAIVKAMGDADINLRDHTEAGGTLKLVDALTHFVTVINDNDEEVEATRTVLIDEEGKTYSTVANGAVSSLSNLFNIYGLPPYSPALHVKGKIVKTRKGFRTLNIVPV